MAGHKYITNSSNLFDDEDVDDETFVNSYRPRIPATQSKPTTAPYGGHIAELERQRQAMLLRQREIEQRTLDSSHRSIGLLRESEQIGVQTAEELVRQREQLETTNKRLDEINTNLNYSQKHLNGIKNVFHGLKNYISGKSNDTPARSQTSPDASSMKGRPSGSGLVDTITDFNNDITPEDRFRAHPSSRLKGLDQQTMAEPIPDSQRINKMLDDNLEEMVQHITRLKGLGVELGREIDTQNELIDNIQDKVEVADIKIHKQNKTMNKLLGK
ncbi:synaptosomal-associated protein 29-like [Hyposmocoma kahamanoa]|uniref:synaptosomal-associated protein 29-like n=1 Tax=Hyposmocoma kahamanoa TaxID=1477025 RepID=UPI000E6D63D0|nr:synaptosomal-associated protein 29-like [Hyposmocoma kahamanoa]